MKKMISINTQSNKNLSTLVFFLSLIVETIPHTKHKQVIGER